MQLSTLLRRSGIWARGPAEAPDGADEAPAAGASPDDARTGAGAADAVPRPVLLGTERAPAVQIDGTTCGPAVLVVLAADGDPAVAAWLDGAGDRFAALQRSVQRRTTRTALLGVPWPQALGTPPWAAARAARWGSVRYGHRVVDDTDPVDLARVRAQVDSALARGVPVPLYTGGDTSRGWTTALPRHVVLVLPGGPPDAYRVYEPGSGAIHTVRRADLWSGGRPLDALGRWPHVAWALLPRPRAALSGGGGARVG
ncbi:hypothetical protein [Luteimicrobium sp. DT211]|uniref:hypothetical protein n=1 Tax=Luteimicrobium sp. DT211 TaxID=3393412 RepID=UPI003CF17AF7